MKKMVKGFGMFCGGILVFALALLVGSDVPISGWVSWYLFALSLGTVGGMVAMINDHEGE